MLLTWSFKQLKTIAEADFLLLKSRSVQHCLKRILPWNWEHSREWLVRVQKRVNVHIFFNIHLNFILGTAYICEYICTVSVWHYKVTAELHWCFPCEHRAGITHKAVHPSLKKWQTCWWRAACAFYAHAMACCLITLSSWQNPGMLVVEWFIVWKKVTESWNHSTVKVRRNFWKSSEAPAQAGTM